MSEESELEEVAKAIYGVNPFGVWNNRVVPMVFEAYAWDDGSLEEDQQEVFRLKARAAISKIREMDAARADRAEAEARVSIIERAVREGTITREEGDRKLELFGIATDGTIERDALRARQPIKSMEQP